MPPPRTKVYADLEAFKWLCSLLEALGLDDEDVRLSLTRVTAFPSERGGVRCLAEMLEFIEHGDYHAPWKDLPGDGAQPTFARPRSSRPSRSRAKRRTSMCYRMTRTRNSRVVNFRSGGAVDHRGTMTSKT
jgi:hypothetical protein